MCDVSTTKQFANISHIIAERRQVCRPSARGIPSNIVVVLVHFAQNTAQPRGYVKFLGMSGHNRRVCTYYQKTGRCRYGDACRFSHSSPSMEQTAGFQERVWSHQQVRSLETINFNAHRSLLAIWLPGER